MIEDNIESTKQLLEADAHVTEEELSTELGISVGSVHTILKEKLLVTKVCSRWIPHSLSDEQKLCRVQFSQDMLAKFGPGANYPFRYHYRR